MKKKVLVVTEPKALEVTINSPAEMIRQAVTGKADLAQLKELLAIQKEWEANEAKKSYVKAMADFKGEAPVITKDKNNKQYNSKYTSLSNLVNTVNPVLSKHGLSASWDIEQNGIIKVACRITHQLGHSETASASAPADVSGAKNAIQQIKSTITYLKAVTFESICGLASTDANLDDDGKIAATEFIDEKQLNTILDNLAALNLPEKGFLEYMHITKLEEMPKSDYNKAIAAINAKKAKMAK